jgi:hypothetical protein
MANDGGKGVALWNQLVVSIQRLKAAQVEEDLARKAYHEARNKAQVAEEESNFAMHDVLVHLRSAVSETGT